MSPRRDSEDYLLGSTSIIACRETHWGVQRVYQMVGYAAAGISRRFGRANVEAPVELEGIAIDDFTREGFGDPKRQLALSRGGRADDGD